MSEASISLSTEVSTHSRAEAAAEVQQAVVGYLPVSTHSRAEAAAKISQFCEMLEKNGFNTQPRGGGCSLSKKAIKISVLNTVFR